MNTRQNLQDALDDVEFNAFFVDLDNGVFRVINDDNNDIYLTKEQADMAVEILNGELSWSKDVHLAWLRLEKACDFRDQSRLEDIWLGFN